MKCLAAALVTAALILTACADQIIGRTEGTAVPAPQKIDCNLIFPPVTVNP